MHNLVLDFTVQPYTFFGISEKNPFVSKTLCILGFSIKQRLYKQSLQQVEQQTCSVSYGGTMRLQFSNPLTLLSVRLVHNVLVYVIKLTHL